VPEPAWGEIYEAIGDHGRAWLYPLEIVVRPQLTQFWNCLVAMYDNRLVKQTFTGSVSMAGLRHIMNTYSFCARVYTSARGGKHGRSLDLLTDGPALATVAGGVAADQEAYLATLGARTSRPRPATLPPSAPYRCHPMCHPMCDIPLGVRPSMNS